jgi:hypothetical protein
LLAKSRHAPVTSPSCKLVCKPGDVVAVDLVGPFPTAIDGSLYGLVIHNIFSHMTSVVGLKSKADAPNEIISWIQKFTKQTGFEVYCTRSDNAGKLTSNAFNLFLSNNDIHHEMSIPYEHHQNGSVKRTNRSLLDMAHTFMVHARLPASLWFCAFKQAAFIFNRMAHKGQAKSPFELCLGLIKPSLDMIRVFGCWAYLHNIKYPKQFFPRSLAVVHVGVSDTAHGWILWNQEKNCLECGASVIFHEDDLPCTLTDSDALGPVLSSIHHCQLGDFSLLQEFAIQDACLESVSALLPFMSDAPKTYHQALWSEQKADWLNACDVKIGMMLQLGVWEEVPAVVATEVLMCRWVFALKRDQEGKIVKFKACIVAQGFKQVFGINVSKTFAPTPTFSLLRLLLAMASCFCWPVASFDVKSTFLHSNIDHDIYIQLPPGVQVPDGSILKLRKALYGTRQASRCWWLHLKSKLATIGFLPNLEDQSSYTYSSGDDRAFLWVHVDNGLFTASSPALLDRLKSLLDLVLDLKWDASLSCIVGLWVRESGAGFVIDQPMLVQKIINCDPLEIKCRTPLASTDLTTNPSREMDQEYFLCIGCLLYLSQGLRPDITFSVNFLARFSMSPDESHWAALEHLISYICYTSSLSLPIVCALTGSEVVKTFVDANWGGKGARLVHGFLTLAWGAPVSWASKRQTCAARSTARRSTWHCLLPQKTLSLFTLFSTNSFTSLRR